LAESFQISEREENGPVSAAPLPRFRAGLVLGASAIVILLAIGVLVAGGEPRIDPTANALRPRHSPAYAALDKIQKNISSKREPLWIIVSGKSEAAVGDRLRQADAILKNAVSNHWIASFNLPAPLWPRPQFQKANEQAAKSFIAERLALLHAAISNGFTTNSVALADRILDTWQAAASEPGAYWPTNPMSQWIFQKFAARTGSNYFALGLVTPAGETGNANLSGIDKVRSLLPREDTWLSGWELLGNAIFSRVKANMWKVISPMIFLVLLSLWLAFRRPREILLSLGVLALSGACLLASMRTAGWSWNLLNMMAIPLILGAGVDYSIFMQLALRRHHGDLRMAYFSVGRALLLCGGTAVAGFGSLSLSSNAGMASLGRVCAVGIGSNMLIAIYLLPVWWRLTRPAPAKNPPA
ncbi:MAG TPA: MMPL family transporter, partial [Verrucomicrobiae bacterium]|nr:MMPL family transporter [Verrucomicrobiae bacterium]